MEIANLEDNAIFIAKQDDGNWKGWMKKNGVVAVSRAGDPGTVLQELITHE